MAKRESWAQRYKKWKAKRTGKPISQIRAPGEVKPVKTIVSPTAKAPYYARRPSGERVLITPKKPVAAPVKAEPVKIIRERGREIPVSPAVYKKWKEAKGVPIEKETGVKKLVSGLKEGLARKVPKKEYAIYERGERIQVTPKAYKKWKAGQRKQKYKALAYETLKAVPGISIQPVPDILGTAYRYTPFISQPLRKFTYEKMPKKKVEALRPDVYYAKRPSGKLIAIPKSKTKVVLEKETVLPSGETIRYTRLEPTEPLKMTIPKKESFWKGVKSKAYQYVRREPEQIAAIGTEIAITAGVTTLMTAPKTAIPRVFKGLTRVKPGLPKIESALIKRPIKGGEEILYKPIVKAKQPVTLFFKKQRLFGLLKPKTIVKKGATTLPTQEIGVIQKGKGFRIAEKSLWTQIRMRPGLYGKQRVVQASKVDLVSLGVQKTPKKQVFITGIKSKKMFDVSKAGYKLAPGKTKTRFVAGESQELISKKTGMGAFEKKAGVFITKRIFKSSGRLAKKPTIGAYKQTEFLWTSPRELPSRTVRVITKEKPTLLHEAFRAKMRAFRLTKPFKVTKPTKAVIAGKRTLVEVPTKSIAELRTEQVARTQAKILLEEETMRISKYAQTYRPTYTVATFAPKTIISRPRAVSRTQQITPIKSKIKATSMLAIPQIEKPTTKRTQVIPATTVSRISAVNIGIGQVTKPIVRERAKTRTQIIPKITTTIPHIGFIMPGYITTVPPPPLVPFLLPTPRLRKGIRKKKKKKKRKYRYQPSLAAITFRIKGRRPKRLTGLEIRPL